MPFHRCHSSMSLNERVWAGGENRIDEGVKGEFFFSVWFRRYRANAIVANDNFAPVASGLRNAVRKNHLEVLTG